MALRGKEGPSSCAPLGEAECCAARGWGEPIWAALPLPALPQFTSDCSRGVFWRERGGGEGEATHTGLLMQPGLPPPAPRTLFPSWGGWYPPLPRPLQRRAVIFWALGPRARCVSAEPGVGKHAGGNSGPVCHGLPPFFP